MRRKLLGLLMMLMVCIGLSAGTVFADEVTIVASGTCGATEADDVTWTLDSTGKFTVSGTGAMRNYSSFFNTPWYSSYRDYSFNTIVIEEGITRIGAFSFQDNNGEITSAQIPDTVTVIGNAAFRSCGTLSSITLPADLTEIGEAAFSRCGFTEITIPNKVKTIGNAAFDGVPIKRVVIPDSVETLGGAFNNCGSLSDVTLGKGITKLENDTFYNCPALKEISIPANVKTIGNHTFAYSGLTAFPQISEGASVSIESCAFRGCNGLTAVSIPEGVASVGEKAFWECTNLASVSFPDSLTELKAQAFADDPALTEVRIPGTLTTIGTGIFEDCTGLKTVVIDDGITFLPLGLFYGCTGLENVTVPESVAELWGKVFQNCTSLKAISLPGVKTMYSGYDFSGCTSLTDVKLGSGLTSIPERCFFGCTSLKKITIPDSVEKIRDYAFGNCESLASVTIPDGVTEIGTGTFSGCAALSEITFPDGVTTLRGLMFQNCTGLTSVTIPAVITDGIGGSVFNGCTNLQSVDLNVNGKDMFINQRIANGFGGTITVYGIPGGRVESNADSYGYIFKTARNTIHFVSEKGIGEMPDQMISFTEDTVPLNENTFTYYGSSFKGWNTEADGSGTAYEDKAPFGFDYPDGTTITLYAQWDAIPPATVTFDAGKGSVSPTSKTVEFGSLYGELPTPSRYGHDFTGWYEYAPLVYEEVFYDNYYYHGYLLRRAPRNAPTTGTKVFEDGMEITLDVTLEGAEVTGIDIDDRELDDGDYTIDGSNIKASFTYSWSKHGKMTYNFIDIHCSVIPDDYEVNDFKCIPAGCGTDEVTAETVMERGDHTLYAVWDEYSYDVSVKAGAHMTLTGGEGKEEQTVNGGGSMTGLTYTAEDGYYFPEDYASLGTTDGVTVYRQSESSIYVYGTPTASVTLTLADASLIPPPTVTISFDAGGGTGEMKDVEWESGTEYQLPDCLFNAPEGKTFDKWTADGNEYQPGDTVTVKASGTFTAVWKDVPAHVHDLTLVKAKPATCTTAGNTDYYTCSGCDKWFRDATGLIEITDKNEVVTPALGHDWDDGVVTKEPTETETGIRTFTCRRDKSHTRTEVIPMLAHTHTLTKVDAADASCTSDGHKAYYVCSGCGLWFSDAEGTRQITDKASVIIPATGHDWDEGIVTKEPTLTETGIRLYTCRHDSSHTKTEVIPKLGTRHNRPSNTLSSSGSYTGSASAAGSSAAAGASSAGGSGSWSFDAAGWHYTENGKMLAGTWRYLGWNGRSYWYYFDENTVMRTGWFDWNGYRFYLYPVSDGWKGRMLTGWQQIDGKWYYFEPDAGKTQGHLYVNTVTPDGYRTGADGARQ